MELGSLIFIGIAGLFFGMWIRKDKLEQSVLKSNEQSRKIMSDLETKITDGFGDEKEMKFLRNQNQKYETLLDEFWEKDKSLNELSNAIAYYIEGDTSAFDRTDVKKIIFETVNLELDKIKPTKSETPAKSSIKKTPNKGPDRE